jgi:hypothetical protein
VIVLALISTACDKPDEPKREDTTLADPPKEAVVPSTPPAAAAIEPEPSPSPAPEGDARSKLSEDGITRLSVNVVGRRCHVFANDTDLGFAPIFAAPVREGDYKLTIRCTDGRVEARGVFIAGGQHSIQVFKPDR